jgi:hypothetical protein
MSHSTTALSDILPAVTQAMGWEAKVQELALLSLWPTVCAPLNPAYAQKSQAWGVAKRGVKRLLQVSVEDALMASELNFAKEALLEGLNAYAPQTGLLLDGLDIKVKRRGTR